MVGVARKHLKAAYVGLQKFLQQKWAFMQRSTQGLGKEIFPGGEGPLVGVPPGTFPWIGRAHAQLYNHEIFGQAYGDCNHGSDPDGTGKF